MYLRTFYIRFLLSVPPAVKILFVFIIATLCQPNKLLKYIICYICLFNVRVLILARKLPSAQTKLAILSIIYLPFWHLVRIFKACLDSQLLFVFLRPWHGVMLNKNMPAFVLFWSILYEFCALTANTIA